MSGNAKLLSVSIPDSVNEIGDSCFAGDTSLVRVYLNEGLKTIGDNAFNGCTNLEYIDIPDTVDTIGDGAFDGISNITICGADSSAAKNYANNNNITFVERDKEIQSIEIEQLPKQSSLGINESLDTTGLVLKLNYPDGTIGNISEGMSCFIKDKKVGTNTVIVLYEGLSTTYNVEVTGNGEGSQRDNKDPSLITTEDKTANQKKADVIKFYITSKIVVGKGGNGKLRAWKINETLNYKNEDVSPDAITWSSSNASIATINNQGVVKAKTIGDCVITATTKDGLYTATCSVKVTKPIKVKKVSIKKKLKLKKGSSYTFDPESDIYLTPYNATIKKESFKSSNSKIATVSKKGVVKAKKKGTCIITYTVKDKLGNTKSAKCKVTVK